MGSRNAGRRESYDDIVDLFARGTPPQEILRFRPSPKAQARARELLCRSKLSELPPEETDELRRLGDLEHLMQLVKARARLYVEANS
ncbi:MAG: hypothetical protein AB7U20_08585 [Planctomycetaceae bacterium]